MEKPWKVVLAFLAVFVAGAVFGGFFTIGFGSRWASRLEKHETAIESAPAPSPPTTAEVAPTRPPNEGRALQRLPFAWDPKQLMRRYADRLELTPEQKERLQPVIKRAVEDYRRIQRTTFRDTSIVIDHLQQDIAKELTPEQRAKLEQMRARQRELLQRFEERREQRKALQRENAGANAPADAKESSAPEVPATGAR